ncbi:MAG: hypothetical protein LBC64_11215, partial [Fibromonadaceae bacterium]|nr:hypothetical protein [Fibromonadaceae bacterium]
MLKITGLAAILSAFFFIASCEKQSSVKPLADCPNTPPSYESATGEFDPIAVPDKAVPCGEISLWGASTPRSLNMWQDYNSFSV